jgi:hypothetical protein
VRCLGRPRDVGVVQLVARGEGGDDREGAADRLVDVQAQER